jgi:CheY-like chemotaxis protein
MTRSDAAHSSKTRVLIVDDEPDGARALGMLLKMRGFTVEVETDGTRSLSQVESFQPDVVLLDLAMPAISGYEVCRQIRAAHANHIAIIAMSGYGDAKHRKLAIEAGCNCHLLKPAGLEAIEAAIAAHAPPPAAHAAQPHRPPPTHHDSSPPAPH